MAVARRAAGTAATSTSTTLTVTYPTNQVGDLVLMTVATDSTAATPTGWTLLGSSATATNSKTYMFARFVYGAVLSGSQAVTIAASAASTGIMASYSGAKGVVPELTSAKTGGSATAATAQTVAIAGDRGTFAIWANGRGTSSTLSAISASAGTWTSSKLIDASGTVSLAVIDGPITGSASTTTVSATASASTIQNNVSVMVYPSVATTITDTFTGTAGTTLVSYNPAIWSTATSGITATIQSNAAQLAAASATTGTGGYVQAAAAWAGSIDISGTFVVASTDAVVAVGLAQGGNAGTTGSNLGAYGIYLGLVNTTGAISVYAGDSTGTAVTPASATGTTVPAINVTYGFRFQYLGASGTARGRIWNFAGSEPGAWEATISAKGGYVGTPTFSLQNASANARSVIFDNVVIAAPVLESLPFTESFNGNDGVLWPTARWAIPTANTTASLFNLNANRGAIAATSGAFSVAVADVIDLPATTDTDITATVTFDSPLTVTQYVGLSINNDHNNVNSAGNSPYGWHTELQPADKRLNLYYGGISDAPASVYKTFWPSTRTRLRRVGTVFYAKAWQAGTAEPPQWDLTFDQSSSGTARTLGAGVPGLWAQNGDGSTASPVKYYFDDVSIIDPAGFILPYTEIFTGTTGATWPSYWATPGATTSGSTTIQANAGQLAVGTGASAVGASVLTAMTNLSDTDVVMQVTGAVSGVEQYACVIINQNFAAIDGSGNSPNAIRLELGYAATAGSSTVRVFQGNNIGTTQIGQTVTKSLVGTTKYYARLNRIGSIIRARVWDASASEPSTWDVIGSIPGTPDSGSVGVAVRNGAATTGRTFTFDNVSISVPLAANANGLAMYNVATTTLSGASATVTLPNVVGGHGLILTSTNWDGGASTGRAIGSVSDSANGSWVQAGTGIVDGNIGGVQLWYCVSHPGSTGPLTVTVTYTSANTDMSLGVSVSEWTGALVFDNTNKLLGNDTARTITVPSSPGDISVAVLSIYDNSTPEVLTPAVLIAKLGSPLSSNTTAYALSTTTSTSLSYATGNSGYYGLVAASFKMAALPIVSFTSVPATGTAPLTTAFTDTSTNSPTSWSWSFGDGTYSTAQNPSHTYSSPGIYYVILTAANSSGSATITQVQTISSVASIAYTERWTGSTGTNWPYAWLPKAGTATIQSNAGQLLTPGGGTYSAARADLGASPTMGNTDVTGSVVMGAASVEQYAQVQINSDGNGMADAGNNCYVMVINYSASGSGASLTLRSSVSGIKTDLAYSAAKSLVGTTLYNFRFQRVGQVLNGRIWTGTEPTTWDVTYTLTGAPYVGIVALAATSGNDSAVRAATFDDVIVSYPMIGYVKSGVSSSYVPKPVKVWNGSQWLVKPLKTWNGSAWSQTNSAASLTTAGITRNGSTLLLNGVAKRFGGANAYWLGLDDNNGGTYGTFPTHNQITAGITGMKEMGVNLIRAHTVGMSAGTPNSFETAAGVYNDANLDSADWAVYQAKLAGMYMMVPLTDNWNYYHGGKWNFVHWAYQQNPSGLTDTPGTVKDDTNERQFFANTTAGLRIRTLFKDYINRWLNHVNPYTGLAYKDDPTIAIIETGNEIYYAAQIGSNEWTQDICAYVKSIAPNKLLADGSSATGIAVSSAPGLTAAACDIVGGHYYVAKPDYSATVGFTTTATQLGANTSALMQVAADVNAAVANSKAYILGEYPWTRSDVNSLYSTVENNQSISADMFWANIANTDAGVAEVHGGSFGGDDYPVHRPYSGSNEQTYAPALSRHISAMSGIAPTNSAGTGSLITNLIRISAISRASNISAFSIGSGTLALDTTMWMEGGSSLKVTPSAAGVYPYIYMTDPTTGTAVTVGAQYTGVVSVRTTTSTSQGFQAVMLWYKADGSSLSNSQGTYAAATQNIWGQYTVTATAPTSAAYASLQIQAGSAMGTGDIINIDQFGIFAGTNTTWIASA